jgi:heat shock protein HslJ
MNDSTALSPGPTPLCKRHRQQLALLRTGALSPREAAAVSEHSATCPWCQRELAAYDALDAAARQHLAGVAFARLTVEDVLHAAVPRTPSTAIATATAMLGRSDATGAALRRRPRLAALGPLAAALALALFAGLLFATHSVGSGIIRGGTPTPAATAPVATLTNTTWALTRLVVDGHEQQLVPGRAPTLVFGPFNGYTNGIHGRSGCNGVGGMYTLSGDALHFSGMYYTNMYCLPAAVMAQESAYFQALMRVERYRLDGSTLTLASADGRVQLTFRSTTPAAKPTPTVVASPSAAIVIMTSANFVQQSVTIHAGSQLQFVDPSDTGGTHILCLGHDQTCTPNPKGPAELNTGNGIAGIQFNAGDTRSFTFANPGTYEVTCTIHQHMNVIITVQ